MFHLVWIHFGRLNSIRPLKFNQSNGTGFFDCAQCARKQQTPEWNIESEHEPYSENKDFEVQIALT